MPNPRIWILPPEVAERIAAGEVVERPASVVKELVENALDAGARRITVETDAGGKASIRVTDDGQGMTAEEVRLALQRHGTSKLRTADDLFNIHTLGFRGEALPSIAAVSEMEVLTRTPDATEGARLLVEGGLVRAEEPAAAQVGTTVTVRRLFHNVPVREKFLRSDVAEANQITEWLQRLALSRPEVGFRLVHDGREAVLSPGSQDPLNAVVAVLGRAVARELLRVDAPAAASPAGIGVSGFVGRPTLTRANRNLQQFYVNGRSVRSPLFYRALDDAFRAMMPQGRYAAAVLLIEVPPGSVDVNVHPAKTEVRFQDEQAVHAAVFRAAAAALRSDPTARTPDLPIETWAPGPGTSSPRVAEPGYPPGGAAELPAPGALPFSEQAIGGPSPWERRPGSEGRGGYHTHPPHPDPGPRRPFEEWSAGSTPPASPTPPGPDFDPFGEDTPNAQSSTFQPSTSPFPPTPNAERRTPAIAALTLLGQAQDLFILAEGDGRLWVIDQHVAHERVLFDRMTAPRVVAEASEQLLIPEAVELDRAHSLALEEHRELLAELGFGVEPFGPGRYQLRSVPRSLLGRDYATVLRDLADELAERSNGGQTRLRKEEVALAAAGRSCKKAVKAGNRLSRQEMEQLLSDLRAARNPYTCPHGRPVFLTLDPEEVAQLFGGRSCE